MLKCENKTNIYYPKYAGVVSTKQRKRFTMLIMLVLSQRINKMKIIKAYFKFDQLKTDYKTETIAGIITFMTMAYVLLIQPLALLGFGPEKYIIDSAGLKISKESIMLACALCSGICTLVMGLYTNLPFALSTGMGYNFMFGAMLQNQSLSFAQIMSVIFITGVLLIILSVCGLRKFIVKILPKNLKLSIAAAVGFFLAYIGFKTSGIGVFEQGGISLGKLSDLNVSLSLLGLIIICALSARKIKGAIFISMFTITLLSLLLGQSKLPSEGIFHMADFADFSKLFANFSFGFLLTFKGFILALIVIIGEFFNTLGNLLGLASKANLLDKNGNLAQIEKPFLIDSLGSCFGAFSANTVIITYTESAAGIEAGGKSGFTSVITAICFFLMIFASPVIMMIPPCASAPVLIYVGFLMIKTFKELDLSEYSNALGPLVLIIFTIFTASIPGGVCAGVLTHIFVKIITHKYKEIHPLLYLLAIPMILFFIYG